VIGRTGEELIADFRSEYGLDFAEEVFHKNPGKVLILIRQLPPESRTVAKLRGGEEYYGWGTDRYMTAQLIDAVNSVAYAVVASNSKRKPQAPKPFPRPKKNPGKAANNPFRMRLEAAKKAQGR
jgi:hypothetical protein